MKCALLSAVFSLVVSVPSYAQGGVTTVIGPDGARQEKCFSGDMAKEIPCPDTRLFFFEGRAPVQEAFNAHNYKRLDELYTQWCTGKDRFPDGLWKLTEFQGGLASSFEAWKEWGRDLATIKAWQKASPQSAAALYAEATYWQSYAWSARGGGYANTVSKEGWELFRERLDKAAAALNTLQIEQSQCPGPEALRINLMIERDADDADLEQAYLKAAHKYPEYHALHFAMARHFEPKWGGSAAQYEQFASAVAEMTKNFEGMGMYARLYWLVDHNGGLPFKNEKNKAPYWPKLKAGYADLLRLYPSSIHNLGKYAGVACRSNDSALYRQLRAKLEGYEQQAEMLDPIDVCDRRHNWAAHAD